MLSTKVMFAVMIALMVAIGTYLIYEFKMPKFIVYAQEEGLNNQFLEIFNNTTEKTLLNFTLLTHKDQSVSLMAFLPNTTINENGLPNSMRLIAGYPNSDSLNGSNGVNDVLTKLAKSWNVVEIKEELGGSQ